MREEALLTALLPADRLREQVCMSELHSLSKESISSKIPSLKIITIKCRLYRDK